MKLVPGLYEALITRDRAAAIEALQSLLAEAEHLASDAAPQILAHHLSTLLLKALRSVKGEDGLERQISLANELVALLAGSVEQAGIDDGDQLAVPARMLLSIRDPSQAKLGAQPPIRPTLPLRHSDLIVNGPRDLRLGSEIRRELPSADRVDLLVAFLKFSGLRVVEKELDEFCRRRPERLRVLTTTYLGASDVEALDRLRELGADIRVSYDTRRTRLHAKAWLFHRESGFSTGLVGSSNLSSSALLDGCEWNVRLSAVDNAPILTKFQATFAQYWEEGEFEPYDRERFLEATRRRDPDKDALARAVALRPYPHQQQVLDALLAEREAGHHRNLVVAATGTGKTVVAALDYARLRKEWGDAPLLFVAHRREILRQSRATFRAAVRDGHFGEMLVAGGRPTNGRHVFASIQSLHAERLESLDPKAYRVVIVDEFHHAEAATYRRLLEHLEPEILLGLTATPERADGQSILGWFDGRIAAELRLWDALDLGLLAPFQYFGVDDGTDLSWIDWRSGRYDVKSLERLYTGDERRASRVVQMVHQRVRSPTEMRALGFCVSVRHARYMAEYFDRKGLPSVAVTGETRDDERAAALRRLEAGEVCCLFTVDLFNEGVDLPAIDTVLFLRPTESATVFLQQLGRGLRLAEGKDCLTVLDFIGRANRRFRFDRRYGAILGGGRATVRRAIESGFPQLPAGCEMQLDEESQQFILRNIREAIPTTTQALLAELERLGDVRLPNFLAETELGLEDLYRSGRSFTELRRLAGFHEERSTDPTVARALGRLLHVDDLDRLDPWRAMLSGTTPPPADPGDPFQLMLFVGLGQIRRPVGELDAFFAELWQSFELRQELLDLFDLLDDRRRRPTLRDSRLPFSIHASYSRDEISAGLLQIRRGKLLRTQGGTLQDEGSRADILYVTLEKDEKDFTPTTLYQDYVISPTRFHWESQSVTREDSDTGLRYRQHRSMNWRMLLFVRRSKRDEQGNAAPYVFLGPVRYVQHEGEKPMGIVWELERPMPMEFFQSAKLAAG